LAAGEDRRGKAELAERGKLGGMGEWEEMKEMQRLQGSVTEEQREGTGKIGDCLQQ
jgi:hypothetical protein